MLPEKAPERGSGDVTSTSILVVEKYARILEQNLNFEVDIDVFDKELKPKLVFRYPGAFARFCNLAHPSRTNSSSEVIKVCV